MMPGPLPTLETDRLILRPWREEDRVPFAEMNADPEVMQHFPAVMTREKAGALLDRLIAEQPHELVFAAVAERGGGLVGMAGLAALDADFPTGAGVEIGWRLARHAWGRGYATEAARGWLGYGFGTLGLAEIVAFAVPGNTRSRAVMERIGMARDPAGDFDHPRIAEGSPLRRHVLYRLRQADWRP